MHACWRVVEELPIPFLLLAHMPKVVHQVIVKPIVRPNPHIIFRRELDIERLDKEELFALERQSEFPMLFAGRRPGRAPVTRDMKEN